MLNFDKSIKDIIVEYPIIGEFLLTNDVDCADCSLGSCLLKDVLDIHNYSKEMQKEMYQYMEDLVSGKESNLTVFKPQETTNEYSRIIDILIEEHKKILDVVYIAEYIIRQDNFYAKYKSEIDTIIKYFKDYADEFHHGKEEDVLFKYFEKIEILDVMYEEHTLSRSLRRQLVEANDDDTKIKELISEYAAMLKEHINKEDNILFPYLNRKLSDAQKEEIDKELDNIDYSIESEIKDYIKAFNKKEFGM